MRRNLLDALSVEVERPALWALGLRVMDMARLALWAGAIYVAGSDDETMRR